MLTKRQTIPQQSPAHQLIERVVPPHVFSDHQEIAGGVEQGAGMQATRALEGLLREGEPRRQPEEDLWLNLKIILNRRKLLSNRLDRRFAADAATGRTEDVPCQPLEIQGVWTSEPHVDHIALLRISSGSSAARKSSSSTHVGPIMRRIATSLTRRPSTDELLTQHHSTLRGWGPTALGRPRPCDGGLKNIERPLPESIKNPCRGVTKRRTRIGNRSDLGDGRLSARLCRAAGLTLLRAKAALRPACHRTPKSGPER